MMKENEKIVDGEKKGFIVAIDSALAAILLLLFMSIIFTEKVKINERYLEEVGMDIGSILEKTKNFDVNAIETPEQVCAKIELYRENYSESDLIYSSTKYGCGEPKNEYYCWRSFYNGSFYIVRIITWPA